MITYGRRSLEVLGELDPRLQLILTKAAELCPTRLDHRLICGHRKKAEQDAAFASGASQKRWPHSKHNSLPARAVDFTPYPATANVWQDRARFGAIAGFIIAIAATEEIDLRWLGDADDDGETTDGTLFDPGHLELR